MKCVASTQPAAAAMAEPVQPRPSTCVSTTRSVPAPEVARGLQKASPRNGGGAVVQNSAMKHSLMAHEPGSPAARGSETPDIRALERRARVLGRWPLAPPSP